MLWYVKLSCTTKGERGIMYASRPLWIVFEELKRHIEEAEEQPLSNFEFYIQALFV